MLRSRRLLKTIIILSLLTSTLTGCTKKAPVRIGFVAGITGRVADLGGAGRNGATLALEERNEAGGINGHPVELVIMNDEQNPETAQKAVRELIDQKIEAIIGPMTSNMAMATLPLVNGSQTIMVSPTVTTTELSGKDDNFIRVIATTKEYAEKSAGFQARRLGHRRVAAIYDSSNSAYTRSWLNEFEKAFGELGGKVVWKTSFQSSETPLFSPAVKELIATGPDAILIIANAVDAALICQQIRKTGSKVNIFMSEWASTERLIELAGAAAEGAYVSQFINRDDRSARYLKFLESYRSRFRQHPGFAGMAGYDAALVAMEGLAARKRGTSLKETILARGSFQGMQQKIQFDRFGDAARNTFITLIRNGQYITLE